MTAATSTDFTFSAHSTRLNFQSIHIVLLHHVRLLVSLHNSLHTSNFWPFLGPTDAPSPRLTSYPPHILFYTRARHLKISILDQSCDFSSYHLLQHYIQRSDLHTLLGQTSAGRRMSPRRSSRARSSANPPPASQTASSTSSITVKNNNTLPRSASPEDIDDQDDEKNNEPTMPRRSRRNGGDESRDVSQSSKPINGLEAQGLGDDEAEEITRCICGELEYPGPTTNLRQARGEAGKSPNNPPNLPGTLY